MTILASDVTARLTKSLHDIGAIRWPLQDQYTAIDDAQKAIQEARPDAFEITEPVQLALGCKQPVAADCYAVLDLVYNLNKDMEPVSVITKVDRGLMDRSVSGWMTEGADTQVEHWMQGRREREVFWVYPPVAEDPDTAAPGWVEMRYSKRPAAVTAPSSELGCKDEFINSVYYFAMTRLLERDEKFAGSPQAQMFLEKFGMTIGARTEGENQEDQIEAANEGSA